MRDFRKTLMVAMGTTAIAAGLFAGPLGVAAQDDRPGRASMTAPR